MKPMRYFSRIRWPMRSASSSKPLVLIAARLAFCIGGNLVGNDLPQFQAAADRRLQVVAGVHVAEQASWRSSNGALPARFSDRFGTVEAPSNDSGNASVNAMGGASTDEPTRQADRRPRKPER
jgi:hypothetical protein